jgi:hypothetical protein
MATSQKTRSGWLVPGALIALSAIPVVAGAARLVGLAGGVPVTAENERFFAAPVPVVLPGGSSTSSWVNGGFSAGPAFSRRLE